MEYWRINLLDALDHWSRHERVVSVIGYLVSAIIVFSILLFGKGIDEAIIQSLVLGLGFAAVLWLLFVFLIINPSRVWDLQRRGILALLETFQEVRDLDDIIRRLRLSQEEGIGFRADILDDREVSDDDAKMWMARIREGVKDAGLAYEARYASTTAEMFLTANNHSDMIVGLTAFITSVIADLASERDRLRRDAQTHRVRRSGT